MIATSPPKRKGKKNKKQAQTRKAIVGLCLILGLGALLIVAWADMLPRPLAPAAPAQNLAQTALPKAAEETMPLALPAGTPSAAPPVRRPAAFYNQGIRGGMFSEPQPPAPAATPAPPPAPETAAAPADSEPSLVPETPANPFADWSYNGLVTMGDQKMALLENTKTKEGQYVQTGDTFLSAQVENVTEQQVALRDSGKLYTILKSETITVVPLDKSAPYLSENSGSPPQPGNTPGAPPQMSQVPSTPNGMANNLASQFAAMQQYRRQFRGRGRGRGQGGGGGFYGQPMNLTPGP